MRKVTAIKKSTATKRGHLVGSYTVKNRGAVTVSPKSLASLERFGARYSAALRSLAKR